MKPFFRQATPQDAEQILEIYSPFCSEGSAVSFEVRSPAVAEMQQRIDRITQKYPWLVCEHQNLILGYAYASSHRDRAAYQWAVDVAVYIREGNRKTGIGRALYASLFELLRQQGFYKAYAGITLPNPGSVGLHTATGFEPVGVYKNVGYKAGAWRDVGWWQLALQPEIVNPQDPVSVREIHSDDRQKSLTKGEQLLQQINS